MSPQGDNLTSLLMIPSKGMAYQAICEATSADAILYGNFYRPETQDVVIVKGSSLLLYTLVRDCKDDDGSSDSLDTLEKEDVLGTSNENGGACSMRFVTQMSLFSHPNSAHVLERCIFHSYERRNVGKQCSEVKRAQDDAKDSASNQENLDVRNERVKNEEQHISSEHVRATSAVLLAFQCGRICVVGFDIIQNSFVTLSMHVLERRADASDDMNYASLPLRERLRLMAIKDVHVAVCNYRGWQLLSRRRLGKQRRVAVYGRRYIVAYCHDERLVTLLTLCSEFIRPSGSRKHSYAPFSEYLDCNADPVDGESHSIIMVPWLRVECCNDLHLDGKVGFCDGSYFVRGLSFSSDSKVTLLGVLVATQPEAVGAHNSFASDSVIGGMSVIYLSVNPHLRYQTILQRIDNLPSDTETIVGIPPSVLGLACFIFRSVDFVMWHTVFHPTLYWQFTATIGLLNTSFNKDPRLQGEIRFRDAMVLNLDLRDYVIDYVGQWLIMIPRSIGDIYIGRPVKNLAGILTDILWTKTGRFNFELSSSWILMKKDKIKILAAGSGCDVAIGTVVPPEELLGFTTENIDENIPAKCCEITVAEVPTKVTFLGTSIYEKFMKEVGNGELITHFMLPNSGVMRDPRNVTLPELWQVGATLPLSSLKEGDTRSVDDLIVQRSKPQRRPYAPNDRQINVVGVDYVWPKQQSMVGLCDDSRILVLMDKIPIQQVLSVPLPRKGALVPLLYNCCPLPDCKTASEHMLQNEFLLTWNNSTAMVTLNEEGIIINKNNSMMEGEVANDHTEASDALCIITDERSIAYTVIRDNSLAVQITRSKAVFIDRLNSRIVEIISLIPFGTGEESTVKAAEIIDSCIICLYSNGDIAVLGISYESEKPLLSVTHRINNGFVRSISLYRPNRRNKLFSSHCLLVLTECNSLFCYKVGSFQRIFVFTGMQQVHQELFDDNSDDLTFVDMSEGGRSCMTELSNGKRYLHEWRYVSKKRAATAPSTSVDPLSIPETSAHEVSSGLPAEKMSDPIPTSEVPDRSDSRKNKARARGSQGSVTETGVSHMQDAVAMMIDRRKKESSMADTLEYVISVQMVDVAPTDEGPTLVMFMTGRPVIIYRSYILVTGDIIFTLHKHRFTCPIPSAVVTVEDTGAVKRQILMQLSPDSVGAANCVSQVLCTPYGGQNKSNGEGNHCTLCYPDLSLDEALYYLVDEESSEVEASVKPLDKEEITETHEINKAVSVLMKRWKEFVAPCLRLTSLYNRLRVHEFEVENVVDIDTVNGNEEARVVSTYSILTHSKDFARYLLLLTRTGTLVLCIPSILEQKTSTNGGIRLKEIVAGSDEPDFFSCKDQRETTWNPLYCSLETDRENLIKANLYCRSKGKHGDGLSYHGELISQMYNLGDLRAHMVAVSHRNYYLSNHIIRANRNAIIAALPAGVDMSEVYCGKLVALAVRFNVNAREELVKALNERMSLQLRQLECEALPPGTKPRDIVEPNKQICTLIETLDAIPGNGGSQHDVWRDLVIVLHMGNLHYWFGEYNLESMISVLSMSFGIIGNREYLIIGTCTNLGENVEAKGDVIIIDLQPMFQRQPLAPKRNIKLQPVSWVTKAQTCVTLVEYYRRIFPGPISFLSSLNTDFDTLLRPTSNSRSWYLGKPAKRIANVAEEDHKWTMSHFSPNFGLVVHSVGPRLFVHEVSGKQFVRGAFAEVPLCVSTACVFDKYVVAGDLNMGLHLFMYRQDAMNDSRTLCKISSTVRKVDASIVACAPLVNSNSIGVVASDYFANLMLFKNNNDEERNTLVLEAAVRLPARITQFVRREMDFRYKRRPSGLLGFSADGSIIYILIPDDSTFEFFRSIQTTMESLVPAPLGVPRTAFSQPLFTSQMTQTQGIWPDDDSILSLDVLRCLPFQTTGFLDNIAAKVSAEVDITSYQILNALNTFLI